MYLLAIIVILYFNIAQHYTRYHTYTYTSTNYTIPHLYQYQLYNTTLVIIPVSRDTTLYSYPHQAYITPAMFTMQQHQYTYASTYQ